MSVTFIIAVVISGCVQTPSLDQPFQSEPRVQVANIVDVARCEFENAAISELYQNPKVIWLKSWSTKIHLTLAVDATMSVNPGATLTQPFHNAYNITAGPSSLPLTPSALLTPAIASVPQFFTVGGGFGLTTQAIRTEDLEFDLAIQSFDAFKDWSPPKKKANEDEIKWAEKLYSYVRTRLQEYVDNPRDCRTQGRILLEGDLGFGEWLRDALTPVYEDILRAERNPPPAGFAGSVPMSTQEAAETKALSALMQKERTAAANQSAGTSTLVKALKEQPREMFQVSGQLISPEKESLRALEETKILGELEREANELQRKTRDVKKHAKAVYETAQTLYKGIITPMGEVGTRINAAAPDCTALMQPLLVGGALSFALATNSFSKINDYDMSGLDAISKIVEKLKRGEYDGGSIERTVQNLKQEIGKTQTLSEELSESLKKLQDAQSKIVDYAEKVIRTFQECIRKPAPKAPDKLYDPLSVISHQINFVVTYGGSVNPTWKLARVSTPNAPFFLANRKFTNSLIIAMGREAKDVSAQIQTQLLRSAFQQVP